MSGIKNPSYPPDEQDADIYSGAADDIKRSSRRPIKEMRRVVTLTLILIAMAAVCFLVGFFTGGQRNDGESELSAIVVQNQLERVSELTTAKYYYTNMGQFSQSSDFYGVRIPFSGKHFIVSYDGVILAGVDLKEADIDITDRRITVTLPSAEILSHEIDEESLKVFDETKNIFNPITIKNYNDFYAEQKAEAENKALESGLAVQAEEQAELVVNQIIGPLAEQNGMELKVNILKQEGLSH